MKNINLDKSEDLTKLKESFNKTIDKHIAKIELNEKINQLNDCTFGGLKLLFENVLSDLFESNDGKKILKNFIKTIKENKSLKEAYLLYEQINKIPKNFNDTTLLYLFESASENVNVKEFISGKNKLCNIVKEGIKHSSLNANDINNILNIKKDLNESYDYLLTTPRKSKNIVESYESIKVISNYINENTINDKKVVNENNKSQKELCKDLNNLLKEDLNEWEKDVIIDITLNDMLEKPKHVLFEEYKNKCITTIDSCMSHCDLKEKATFELMKEQIKSKTYKKESFNDDILKLSELNYTIKNQ